MTTETKTERETSADQARLQLASVRELVAALRAALNSRQTTGVDMDAEDAEEDAREAIHADALSVEVRSGWYELSAKNADKMPAEFCILLATGGPACRIIGDLDEHVEPERARIEHQDWGTPWAALPISGDDEEALLEYARCFYFGG